MARAKVKRKPSKRKPSRTLPRALYKVLQTTGEAPYQQFYWPLPERGKKGGWVEAYGRLVKCRNGLHVTTDPGSWRGFDTDSTGRRHRIYRVQVDATKGWLPPKKGENKYCCRRVRLLRRVLHGSAEYKRLSKHYLW
jgi:hypothetical protein